MIRIAALGDRHVDRRHPAYAESLRCWDFAIQDAISQGVHGFIGLGDVMEVGANTDDLAAISERYAKMLDHGFVMDILGNHEPHGGLRWIAPLTKQRVSIVDDAIQLELVHEPAPGFFETNVPGARPEVAILLIPFCRRGYPPFHEIPGETLLEFYANAGLRIGEMIENVRAAVDPGVPLIVAGHWTPAGFEVGPSEFELTASKEMVVPLDVLMPADLVLVGHIHRAQQIGNIVGVGSMFRTTFAERDQEKSYVIVTVDQGAVTWERRVIPTRPMREIHITGERVVETVAHIVSEDPNQDLKIIVETTPDDKTVYAELFSPLDTLPGRFAWEVVRPTLVVTRAPEIEQSVTIANDFTVWLKLAYPDLPDGRIAAVIEKVESL